VDAAGFRAYLPVFSDTAAWPDTAITAALLKSAIYINATEWTSFTDEATAAWVADRLVTDKVLSTTGPLGSISGLETMKQVGKVTVQRDAQIILRTMANPYLLTSFGRRYNYLVGLVFGGGTVAGASC
jgi:hypothetical protein